VSYRFFLVIIAILCALTLPAKGWQFALCNDTNEAISVSAGFPLCGLATNPKIDYLAPHTCVIIDNSGTWYAGCAISSISFKSVRDKSLLKALPDRYWWDYTFTLKQSPDGAFNIDVTRGIKIPPTIRPTAVLQNMSLLVLGRMMKSFDESLAEGTVTPQDIKQAADKLAHATPEVRAPKGDIEGAAALVIGGVVVGTALVAGLGLLGYDAYKALSSCYRNGKYLVYLTPQDTANPQEALRLMQEAKQCTEACKPNPAVLSVAPETMCGFEVVPDLSKKFLYLRKKQ
jgi:hypothetical protein